jgi:hypothetical protein
MDPAVLLVDEPSIGLEPRFIEMVFEILGDLPHREGKTIVMVEQNARQGLHSGRIARRERLEGHGGRRSQLPRDNMAFWRHRVGVLPSFQDDQGAHDIVLGRDRVAFPLLRG